jgi:hypothetical protein
MSVGSMTPPASASQRIRGDQFVRAVMRKLGARGPKDLARKAQLDPWYVDKRIRNWLQGRNEPNFEATILLLQAAGWLDEDGLRRALEDL